MLPVLLVALAVLFLIMVAAIWAMNRATESLIGQKHRLIEEIVNTGEVPSAWSQRYARKIAPLQQDTTKADLLLRVQRQAQRTYLHKLDQLAHYAEGSPLVADEETRELLLERLVAVRATWAERAPNEFRLE